jgi:hypothetical protein
MSKRIKILTIASIIGILFLGFLSKKFYPGEYFTSDQAYKVKQIRDIVEGQLLDFSCLYPGKNLDPDFSFFPAKYPMVHDLNGKCYYVFPFQFSILNIPFYKIWGQKGIFIGSVFFGFLFLIVWVDLLYKVGLKLTSIFLYSLVLIFGLGLYFYIYIPSDHIATCLLCLMGFSFLLYDEGSKWLSIFGGLALGFAVSLRAETLLFAFIVFFSMFLLKRRSIDKEKYFLGFLSFSIILILFLISNAFFLDHILGMRGHEFDEKKNELFISRFERIYTFLLGRETEGTLIKDTPTFLILILVPFLLKYLKKEETQKVISILFIVIFYILIIPFLIKVEPFLQFGERYLLVIYPLFLLVILLIIEKSSISKYFKNALLVLLIVSSIYSCNKSFSLIKKLSNFTKYSLSNQKDFENKMNQSEVVVLRSLSLNGIFLNYSNLNKKVFLAVRDEKFLELIELLRKNGINTIAVAHIRIRDANIDFVKEKSIDLSKTFVPIKFKFQKESADLGNEWIELRNYQL